jgi:hypothetical protein
MARTVLGLVSFGNEYRPRSSSYTMSHLLLPSHPSSVGECSSLCAGRNRLSHKYKTPSVEFQRTQMYPIHVPERHCSSSATDPSTHTNTPAFLRTWRTARWKTLQWFAERVKTAVGHRGKWTETCPLGQHQNIMHMQREAPSGDITWELSSRHWTCRT